MNPLQKFFILCSGSNLSVLQKSKSEWNKHAGMGGVVFFTAVFATISATYAIYTAFGDKYQALFFGLVWGFMIFNLDRFIVSSMKKTGGFSRQFFTALPRVVLAVFLGIVIAKPLELKIFEKEIDKQLNVIIERNKRELHASMNTRFKEQTKLYQNEREELNAKYRQLREEYNQASVELEKEIIGTGSATTSGKVGFGTHAKRKEELKKQKFQELKEFEQLNKGKLDGLDAEIATIHKNLQNEIQSSNTAEHNFNGFAARMQALDELGENNKIIALASLFIMGIFISLEIAPILAKLISPQGPYDYLLDAHEHEFENFAAEKKTKTAIASENRIKVYRLSRG